MTIYNNSRYLGEPSQLVKSEAGVNLTIYKQPHTTSVTYTTYTAVAGDSFDLLANRLYGDPLLWWKVADVNPHVFYPGVIRPGTILRIPLS